VGIVDQQQQSAEEEWLEAWLAGPARTRLRALPAQIGDPAPDLTLPDAEGMSRKLSEFWRERPALLLFLRQFGCSCLAERWAKLRDEVAAFVEVGAQVVAVCQAEAERAAAVARRRGYPFPMLCDPDRRAYETYGLVEGTPAQILHDFAWKPGDRATGEKMVTSRRGSERALVDSPWQLPGEFVIARSGRLTLTHRYQYCEDFPPKTVILGAIQAAGDPR
jgi:peroxiredoxin